LLARDGEALKVIAVAPGSAGEKAGVAEGSRVVLVLAEAGGTRSVAIVLADAIPPRAVPPGRR
jgi:hypothetical protein